MNNKLSDENSTNEGVLAPELGSASFSTTKSTQPPILPIGMPVGPWENFEEAQNSLNKWSVFLDKTPFQFMRSTKRPAAGKRGVTQTFVCNFHGKPSSKNTKKRDCPFKLQLEECQDGVMILNMGKQCVETFLSTNCWHGFKHQTTKIQKRKFCDIPEEIWDKADVLLDYGVSCNGLNYYLGSKCREVGVDVNFTYQDLHRKFYKDVDRDESSDVNNLLQLLEKWFQSDQSRKYYSGHDKGCHLNKLFVCLDKEHTIWNGMGKKVVLFDTKYRNNKYAMALGCFVTIDAYGNTQVLAASLLASESKEMFSWVFEKFKCCFGSVPSVIITDGDATMAESIVEVWPQCTHLLCTWHLYKNLFEHIHCFFINNNEGWRKLNSMWWRICKRSDVGGKGTFSQEWSDIKVFITSQNQFNQSNLKKVSANVRFV
jgi:hypothetical protein